MEARDLRQQVLLQEGNRRLEMEKLSLIDVSSEDDNLLFSPSASFDFPIFDLVNHSDDEGLVEPIHSQGTDEGTCGKSSATSWSFESNSELKNRRYNLRKSIAWDNAFFTSEGVLNCEELSIVNKTFKKPELHILPEISEDNQCSDGSGVPAGNESLVLQDLEVDLFKQIITGSQAECDEANNTTCSPLNTNSGTILENDDSVFAGQSNLDDNTKVKKSPNQKSCSASRQKSGKTPMDSCESNKGRGKECKSSVRPPNTLVKVTTPPVSAAPEKKILVSSKILRKVPHKAAQGSCTPMSPSPMSSPKSTSSGKTKFSDSGSSHGRSASISSDSSESMSVKGLRTKKETRNAILSTNKCMNSKLCQTVSAIKSIDGMSSDSSSSTCSFKLPQRLKGITRISSRPFTANTSVNVSQPSSVHTSSATHFSMVNNVSPASAGDCSTACTKSSDSPGDSVTSEVDHAKSPGLQRPSSKIGFFDAVTNPQERDSSVLPLKLVAHNSSSNNSGPGSKSNMPKCALGLTTSNKQLKSQVSKPMSGGSFQKTGNLHPQFGASVSSSTSRTKSSASQQATTCAKAVESQPVILKNRMPSSVKINKKSPKTNLSSSIKHSQVSDCGVPRHGMMRVPEAPQAKPSSIQSIRSGKDEDKCCHKANSVDDGENVASSSSSENPALFANIERRGLRDDHAKDQIKLCKGAKSERDQREQVPKRHDSTSKVENRPKGRRLGPLAIKHNDNKPPSDLKFKEEAVVDRRGQENILSQNPYEEITGRRES